METKKKCSKCWVIKSLDDFHLQNRSKDWHRSECGLCRSVEYYYKKWKTKIVEVKVPAPRVNVWEWIKRLFG
jgi:hypothetical protein